MIARFRHIAAVLLIILACIWGAPESARAQSSQAIYTDSLQNGWQNYGWATLNYANTTAGTIHSGSDSISVTIVNGYDGIQIFHTDMSSTPYASLSFWLNGGANGGQHLQMYGMIDTNGTVNSAQSQRYQLSTLQKTNWQQFTVPLSVLGVSNHANFTGFVIQDSANTAEPTFYLDDISLIANSGPMPTLTLTAPLDGSSLTTPASISFAATVVTNGTTINNVQFLNGATVLKTATSAPYTFLWTNVSAGSYAVSAAVTYNTTKSATSAVANVLVTTAVPVAITVDASRNQHPISPLIYGTAFATANELSDLNFALNRSGGNSETRYNWMIDAHNHANDFYFESIGDSANGTPAASDDSLISASKTGGAKPLITIPMIGWAPILGPGRAKLASYSIAKYGPQTGNDSQYFPDAGNGISTTNDTPITWNTPTDANSNVTVAFQKGLVQHLISTWGSATNGGVNYYLMDNEHSLWCSTHQDVHPVGTTMQEIYQDITNYAGMVKSLDSNALVLGPEEWGWNGYFYSGYDQQWSNARGDYNTSQYPDRGTNGGWDYMPWLLNQLHQYNTTTGVRLLDYFTLHCYPQEGSVSDTNNDSATQLLRNASTRQFWDTTYKDPSWINSIIMLIPRMKAWVAQYYPGTKIGLTEYNWGAEPYINGATAQADVLGIFGRESLDLATRWTIPDPSTPTYLAMKMYRNYDGQKSTFGDTSVSATGPDPDNISTFAAVRSSDGALTVMVINKQANSSGAVSLSISNFVLGATAQMWQLTAANVITRLSDVSLVGNTLATSVPAQSVTLLIVPAAVSSPPRLSGVAVTAAHQFGFSLNGAIGQTYILQSSSNLLNWTPVLTNTLTNTSVNFQLPIGISARGFYRVKQGP